MDHVSLNTWLTLLGFVTSISTIYLGVNWLIIKSRNFEPVKQFTQFMDWLWSSTNRSVTGRRRAHIFFEDCRRLISEINKLTTVHSKPDAIASAIFIQDGPEIARSISEMYEIRKQLDDAIAEFNHLCGAVESKVVSSFDKSKGVQESLRDAANTSSNRRPSNPKTTVEAPSSNGTYKAVEFKTGYEGWVADEAKTYTVRYVDSNGVKQKKVGTSGKEINELLKKGYRIGVDFQCIEED